MTAPAAAEVVSGLVDLLGRQVLDRRTAPGVQVAVQRLDGDGAIEVACRGVDALGAPIRPGSTFSTYCAVKPVLALLVARAIDQGELSAADVVGDLLDCHRSVAPFTVEQLLRHQVAVEAPDGLAAGLLDLTLLRSEVARFRAHRPEGTAYSEVTTWMLVSLVLEQAHGMVLADIARSAASDLGLEGLLHRLAGGVAPTCVNGVYEGRTRPVPLLAEQGPAYEWTVNPGFGGACSVADLVEVLWLWRRSIDGSGPISAATARRLAAPSSIAADRALGRPVRFAAGLMVDLGRHWGCGPTTSTASYGHLGLKGCTATWVDPVLGIAVGYHLAGFAWDDARGERVRQAVARYVAGAAGDGPGWEVAAPS